MLRQMKPILVETTKRSRRFGLRAERKGVAVATSSEPTTASTTYLTKGDVAKRLGLKPRTVSKWATQGKLPAYRVGQYLRFKWAEVEAHLAATCRCVPHGHTEPQTLQH